jgi:hypothetical protein
LFDGRIAGWKGRGPWTANGDRTPWLTLANGWWLPQPATVWF